MNPRTLSGIASNSLIVFAVTGVVLITEGCASSMDYYVEEREMPSPCADMAVAPMIAIAQPNTAGLATTEAPEKSMSAQSMIFTAEMTLLVANVNEGLSQLEKLAKQSGGYMQSMSENSIVLRIPSPQFQTIISNVALLGTVTKRDIQGTDISEEMWDLDIRLKNKETMLARLVALSEKGGKVADLITVEKEMQRITEELERIKGRRQYLQAHAAYSTLTVRLNAPVLTEVEEQEVIPFSWIRELGPGECINGIFSAYTPISHWFWGIFHFPWLKLELPENYILVEEDNSTKVSRAVSGDGVILSVSRIKNFQDATQPFWTKLIRRHLTSTKAVALDDEREITLANGQKAFLFSGLTHLNGKPSRYILCTITGEKYVHVIECAGPQEAVDRDQAGLEKFILSLPLE